MDTVTTSRVQTPDYDWTEIAHDLGRRFAERAAHYDRTLEFVAENYRELREEKLFSAGIPEALGGGGAGHDQLCNIVRVLGSYCGSTALAFAMSTHPVAVNVFKHLKGDAKATETLRKLAAKELIVAGTGANDWLSSSGTAVRVEGGYRVSARKHFVSGSPSAHVFVTSTQYAGQDGTEVLHFSIPFSADGVRIEDNWRTLGMRGTGSHDITLEDVFVPDEAIVARRPAGAWHPMWNAILPVAMPLITACYVGLAEAASEYGVQSAKAKGPYLAAAVGEMTNSLTEARVMLSDMVRIADNYRFTPDVATASAILTRKSLAARAVKATVEKAAEIVGGAGFFQDHPLERIVRDVRAMHFHPLPEARQQIFSGRVALDRDPVEL
jgi:alkylation response protein AidB-like acyl-CoA dehydrogenase